MTAAEKFSIFWWGLCLGVVVTYASFNGWSTPYIVGAMLYGGLLIFEILRHRKKWGDRGDAGKRKVDPSAWQPMFGRAHGDWYRWFAWRPVRTLDRGLVWLRPVWRRRVYKHSSLPGPSASWFQNLVELRYIYE